MVGGLRLPGPLLERVQMIYIYWVGFIVLGAGALIAMIASANARNAFDKVVIFLLALCLAFGEWMWWLGFFNPFTL